MNKKINTLFGKVDEKEHREYKERVLKRLKLERKVSKYRQEIETLKLRPPNILDYFEK